MRCNTAEGLLSCLACALWSLTTPDPRTELKADLNMSFPSFLPTRRPPHTWSCAFPAQATHPLPPHASKLQRNNAHCRPGESTGELQTASDTLSTQRVFSVLLTVVQAKGAPAACKGTLLTNHHPVLATRSLPASEKQPKECRGGRLRHAPSAVRCCAHLRACSLSSPEKLGP